MKNDSLGEKTNAVMIHGRFQPFTIGHMQLVKKAIEVTTPGTKILIGITKPDLETDNQISKNIWYETIEECLKDKDESWYEIPNNVVGVLVDPITGELPDKNTKHKRMFYYIKGTEPTYQDINLDVLIPTIKEE